MIFKLGELFCGPGGLSLAATTSKINNPKYRIIHTWATDYDKDTCDTYWLNICAKNKENFVSRDNSGAYRLNNVNAKEKTSVIHKDVRRLDMNLLSDISALVFGFPCNDFSVVGEQKGIDGVYGPLYTYGIKAIKKFRPQWFLAENVGGLKNSNDGNTFNIILKDMFEAGYDIYPHLYKFNEYGVPQARQRIIIVGIRKDIDVKFGIPSTKPYADINNTCRNALENPPIPLNAPNNELTKQSQIVIDRLSHIKPGENAFTADLPKKLQLNVQGAKISQIYKKLDPDKPSYTVTGSGGGGTHVYHWNENRALTNRERARLQTFPDDYIFIGSKESVRKQIGMAVPVEGAKIIFEAILNSFAGIKYITVASNLPCMIHEKEGVSCAVNN